MRSLEGGGSGRAEIGYLVSEAMTIADRGIRFMQDVSCSLVINAMPSDSWPYSRPGHRHHPSLITTVKSPSELVMVCSGINDPRNDPAFIVPQFVNIFRLRSCSLQPTTAERPSPS